MVWTLACVKNGSLLLLREGRAPDEVPSPYAEQVRARELATQRKNSWKTQGTGAQFMGGGTRMLWGQSEVELPPARIVGVTRGREPGEVLYAITTGVVTGVFAQSPPKGDEQRIFHSAEVAVGELSLSLEEAAIVCSVEGKAGSTAIGVLEDDGRGVRTVTEGDVVDRAPRWVPGGRREIVYASAGIGRTKSGGFGGLSPFAIHKLSLKTADIEVVVADRRYDHVAPVALSSDVIYAIRRPYRDPYQAPSFFATVVDLLLAPFRVLFALFQYLSFFTARYTGKPLMTSGNARQKAADARQMMVWGNLVDVARQAERDGGGEDDANGSGYELVRITKTGVEVVAPGVLAFDVASDGAIFYSTGRALMRWADGKSARIAELDEVEQLTIIE
jgi:hypothetical protein